MKSVICVVFSYGIGWFLGRWHLKRQYERLFNKKQ